MQKREEKQNTKRMPVICLVLTILWLVAALDITSIPDVHAAEEDGWDDFDDITGDDDGSWKRMGSRWYYYTENGVRKKGWLLDINDDAVYYLDKGSGVRQTGWQEIDDRLYCFDKRGRLQTGWKKRKDQVYFLKESGGPGEMGKAFKGWHVINGHRYHFSKDGVMSIGRTEIQGDVYYFKQTGEQRTGWVQEDSFQRYYYPKAVSEANWGQPVKEKNYRNHYFSKDGLTSPAIDQCGKILDQIGWDLRVAYQWSAGLSYSGRTTYLEHWGSEKLAQQGFDHHTGNCYVMAATFYEMAKCLGYNAHQVAGAVPSRRGGLANHSWVEIDEEDGVWVYDPNCTMETGADRYRFHYGRPGTWRYTNYHRMN